MELADVGVEWQEPPEYSTRVQASVVRATVNCDCIYDM